MLRAQNEHAIISFSIFGLIVLVIFPIEINETHTKTRDRAFCGRHKSGSRIIHIQHLGSYLLLHLTVQ